MFSPQHQISHFSTFFFSALPPFPPPSRHRDSAEELMVKFSKELEAQLIPEWKHAFVNYWQLKKHIKNIKLARKSNLLAESSYGFGRSIFDPIRYFICAISGTAVNGGDQEQHITQEKCKSSREDDDEEEEEEEEEEVFYDTDELDQLFSEEDEVRVFFQRLDEELNKVNNFHKTKENEFVGRLELLNKQLETLLDLKRLLNDRRCRRKNLRAATPASSGRFSESNSEHCDNPTDSETDDVTSALDQRNDINFDDPGPKGGKWRTAVKVDIPATTPAKTIAAVTSMLWDDLLKNPKKGEGEYINRKKIQCAEKMIRGAFVELYRGLGLLKRYSWLNMVAFTKILKKFDKVSNQEASSNYLKVVKRSNFISSDKVVKIMDEVECIFTHHFADDERKKAMKFLRPRHHKDSHIVTFLVGLFTGSFVTLFSVYAILAHLSGILSPTTQAHYMETVYPIFSMFALVSLHMFMYGCNLLMWKSTRINYNFIFEFHPTTALNYRDAFLICTSLMTAVVGAMVVHIILISTGVFPRQADFIPGTLLLCSVLLLICPLNIFYRPTRFCFLRVIRNIIGSPFYKVLMVDFFMADQLTSQIPLLRHMESAACYFVAGSFRTHRYDTCKSGKLYKEIAYVISFAPYYWRAMQCARRWFDENNIDHIANLGKYVSAMVAAGARLTYANQQSQLWMVIVLVTSVIATVYQLYWDFVKDWGLLNPKSKNPWLRDDLVLKNRGIYYGSMALNVVLRVAWVETVMKFNIGMFESRLLDFFLASLEVIRRGHWNYYRLENEHLNNVGKFRAVKMVPLPFRDG